LPQPNIITHIIHLPQTSAWPYPFPEARDRRLGSPSRESISIKGILDPEGDTALKILSQRHPHTEGLQLMHLDFYCVVAIALLVWVDLKPFRAF